MKLSRTPLVPSTSTQTSEQTQKERVKALQNLMESSSTLPSPDEIDKMYVETPYGYVLRPTKTEFVEPPEVGIGGWLRRAALEAIALGAGAGAAFLASETGPIGAGAAGWGAYEAALQLLGPELAPEWFPDRGGVKDVAEMAAIGAALPVAGEFVKPVFRSATGVVKGAAKGAIKGPTKLAMAPLKKVVQIPFPGFEKVVGRKTIQELFQPAIERLPSIARPAFRRPSRVAGLMRENLTKLMPKLESLPVEDRIHLYDWLSKGASPSLIPKDLGPQGLDVANTIVRIVKGTRPKKETHTVVRDLALFERLAKVFSDAAQHTDIFGPDFLGAWNELASKGELNPEKVQQALRRIVKHPEVPDHLKRIAKHLYNLPAETLQGVTNAVEKAEFDLLINKILSNPAWHSPAPKEGFVKSKIKELEGLYLPRDIELALQDYTYSPRGFARWFNEYVMVPWKLGRIAWYIPVHIRNIVGNMILNDIGGLPFYNVKAYKKALQGMIKGSKEFQEFSRMLGQDITWAGSELYDVLGPARIRSLPDEPHRLIDKVLDAIDRVRETAAYKTLMKPAARLQRLYKAEELWAKFAKYLHNLEKGMTKTRAFEDAVKWTFNYAEVTPLIQKMRATVMPFVTWEAKVIPLFFEALEKNPIGTSKWLLVPILMAEASLKQLGLTDDEWEKFKKGLPKWLQQGWLLPLPFRDERGRIQVIDLTWMVPGWGDIWQLSREVVGPGVGGDVTETTRYFLQGPLFDLIASIMRNETSWGTPLYNEWDDPAVKYLKVLAYIWTTWMPRAIGSEMMQASRVARKEKHALTPTQFALRQVGVPIKAYDLRERIAKGVRRKQRRLSEIRSELRRILTERPNLTIEQKRKLIEKYRRKLREEARK